MPSTQNATNITLDSKPAPQNTTGTMVHMFPMQHYTPIWAYHTYKMSSTQNATNITLHWKPAPQNTTGTMVQYVSNATLHADLGISYVQDAIHQKRNKHHTTLEAHENPLLKTLLLREQTGQLT
jgi:hypothetical protein